MVQAVSDAPCRGLVCGVVRDGVSVSSLVLRLCLRLCCSCGWCCGCVVLSRVVLCYAVFRVFGGAEGLKVCNFGLLT